jgi:hypothetical protein
VTSSTLPVQGLDSVCQQALSDLPEIEATARVRGLKVCFNRYLARTVPLREVLAVILKPGGGRRRDTVWWPSWGRAKAAGRLVLCRSWQQAIELAVEGVELGSDPPMRRGIPC